MRFFYYSFSSVLTGMKEAQSESREMFFLTFRLIQDKNKNFEIFCVIIK